MLRTGFWICSLATLSTWAGTAHAAFIHIEYTGTISSISGTGLGYAVGDAFTGQMLIDTSRVAATQYCGVSATLASCEYVATPDSASTPHTAPDPYLVTGGLAGFPHSVPPLGAKIIDGVYVNDLYTPYAVGADGQPSDDFVAYNGFLTSDGVSSYQESNWLRAFDSMADFISGNGLLQTFELTRDELGYYANMYGHATQRAWLTDGSTLYSNEANYLLSSLRVTPVSVPEPGTLALLGIGLAGLIGSRRRR